MSEFVKFSVTDDLRNLQDEIIKKISKSGKIKIGINEVTKAIERGSAKLVAIAEDVSPAEIVMHIPVIAKEKKIPFTYFKTKVDLGKAAGISAKASSIAILDAGVVQKELVSLVNKINDLIGGKKTEEKPKVKETPKEKPKKETPKEEVKEKPKEIPKEAPKEEVKEKPKEIPKEAPKEEVKEKPKEIPKEAPKEEPKKEALKEEVKEKPKEIPKEVPKEEVKEKPKEIPKEAPKEEVKEAPKEVPKEAPKEESKEEKTEWGA